MEAARHDEITRVLAALTTLAKSADSASPEQRILIYGAAHALTSDLVEWAGQPASGGAQLALLVDGVRWTFRALCGLADPVGQSPLQLHERLGQSLSGIAPALGVGGDRSVRPPEVYAKG